MCADGVRRWGGPRANAQKDKSSTMDVMKNVLLQNRPKNSEWNISIKGKF
jgi:hypothetical protein